jgi:hypothetical protein
MLKLRFDGNIYDGRPEYFTDSHAAFVREWSEKTKADNHPIRRDSLDFARLACQRWKANAKIANYAQSDEEFPSYINDNPRVEVAGFMALRAAWFPDSETLGVCHFRRTWCNNLILDYLATHPWLAYPKEPRYEKVGVGTGLLYYLCQLAVKLDAGILWGEATQNSCGFYAHVFKLGNTADLIYAPKERIKAFVADLSDRYAAS